MRKNNSDIPDPYHMETIRKQDDALRSPNRGYIAESKLVTFLLGWLTLLLIFFGIFLVIRFFELIF